MSIVDKIRKSVEKATGLQCHYESVETLNRIWDNADFPCAYFMLLRQGSAVMSGNTLKEQVSVTVYFADLYPDIDPKASEVEKIMQAQKKNAHKWLKSLAGNGEIQLASGSVRTERVYLEGDVVLAGFAVMVDVRELKGDVLC